MKRRLKETKRKEIKTSERREMVDEVGEGRKRWRMRRDGGWVVIERAVLTGRGRGERKDCTAL